MRLFNITVQARVFTQARIFTGEQPLLYFDPYSQLDPSRAALFLDFDGTLVDIASTPQSIQVSPELVPLLQRLLIVFEHRVCIVSGRTHEDITRYLDGIEIDVIAEHGAVQAVRDMEAAPFTAWPLSWSEHLLTVNSCIPNLVVETKQTSVALHYRQQPELEPEVLRFAQLLCNHASSDYMVVTSNMTIEVRRRHIDKGTAIDKVMETPRYRDMQPIFIADDETDIPGFKAVQKRGGLALHVKTDFGGKPENVLRWLDALTRRKTAA